jgi:hypothetical protein
MTPKTSAEWREIWIAKLEKVCVDSGLKKPVIVGYLDFLTRYLAPHSCHPANIPVEAVPSFLRQNRKSEKQHPFGRPLEVLAGGYCEAQAKLCRDALTFFYTNVVLSEKHVQAISKIKSPIAHLNPKKDKHT